MFAAIFNNYNLIYNIWQMLNNLGAVAAKQEIAPTAEVRKMDNQRALSINRAVLKHLFRWFFIPAAGLSLAWFGYLLPITHAWKTGVIEWSLASVVAVIVLEWACRTLSRIEVMAILCLAASALIVGLPLYDIMQLHKIPHFGNLLDYAGTIFMMLVVALITLHYRVDVVIRDDSKGGRRVYIRAQFDTFCGKLRQSPK